MNTPYLILLQGRPAAGKTSIGKEIAKQLQMPFFSKDTVKETMFDAFGTSNGSSIDWSQKIGAVSFEVTYAVIEEVLLSGNSCVVETAWIPSFAEEKIIKILESTSSKFIQVYCFCDEGIREKRFQLRANSDRHPAHMDSLRIKEEKRSIEDKHPKLNIDGGAIDIDTTNFEQVNIPELVSKIKSFFV
jgi:predicted kinase